MERLPKKKYEGDVDGKNNKCRPHLKRVDGDNKAFITRLLSLRVAYVKSMEEEEWRDFMNGEKGNVNVKSIT